MGRNFTIDVPIYNYELIVSIGESEQKLTKFLKELKIKTSEIEKCNWDSANVQGLAYVFEETNICLLRLRRKPSTAPQYGDLAHEVFHVSEKILGRVGMSVCDDSDEAYAYLIGYITEKIYEKL